jgi:hypothetical protein
LLWAVVAVILQGVINARLHKTPWKPPRLGSLWLVPLGFALQFFAIYLPFTRGFFPDWLVGSLLTVSQGILLTFCLLNIRRPGMVLLAAGLALNLTVIVLNGGFMPLPVETARALLPPPTVALLEVGAPIGLGSKDILLPESSIVLPWLADRFTSPAGLNRLFFFSIGDVLVALGVIVLLSRSASPEASHQEMNHAR